MATAVTVTFGANSTQFQAELARMQTMTRVAAAKMSSAAKSGGIAGMSGMIREGVTIPREILEGRGIGRITASLSLFIQNLSRATRESKGAASAARIAADAYGEAAVKANAAAVAAMNKAEASASLVKVEKFLNAESIKAMDTDAKAAVVAQARAMALNKEAVAAETDAVAQEALAASTAGAGVSMIILTGAFVAAAVIAGALYEKFYGLKSVLNELSFSGATDLKDDYIPLLKRHINDVRNAQKEVTDEVKKTVAEYNSAAQAAERQSKVTKEHFDHLKEMLQIQKETELAGARTTAQKEAIEAKYSGKELDLEKQRQAQELNDKFNEKINLQREAKAKLAEANSGAMGTVATKEEDQKTLSQMTQNSEAAKAFLEGGGFWKEFKKNAAVQLGMDPAGTADLIQRTEAGGMDAAQRTIKNRNDFADKVEANDEIRKDKAQRIKDAAKADAAAKKIDLELPDIIKANNQKNSDAAAAAAAKLGLEHAKDMAGGHDAKGYSLNSQQRIGAYAATAPVLLQQLNELRGIRQNTAPHAPPSNHPPGERKPQLAPAPKANSGSDWGDPPPLWKK